jgi:hypothetical protein
MGNPAAAARFDMNNARAILLLAYADVNPNTSLATPRSLRRGALDRELCQAGKPLRPERVKCHSNTVTLASGH